VDGSVGERRSSAVAVGGRLHNRALQRHLAKLEHPGPKALLPPRLVPNAEPRSAGDTDEDAALAFEARDAMDRAIGG